MLAVLPVCREPEPGQPSEQISIPRRAGDPTSMPRGWCTAFPRSKLGEIAEMPTGKPRHSQCFNPSAAQGPGRSLIPLSVGSAGSSRGNFALTDGEKLTK